MNRFPYPQYQDNPFVSQMGFLLPLFFLLSLNYTFMNTVRFISIEKEKQLKEAMKIMGLANWMHYLSWFIRTLIMLLISMVLVTLLLTVYIIFLRYLFRSIVFIKYILFNDALNEKKKSLEIQNICLNKIEFMYRFSVPGLVRHWPFFQIQILFALSYSYLDIVFV